MRKRITGVALVAATLLALHPPSFQQEEIKPRVSLQQDETPASTTRMDEALVIPIGQVPVTFVDTVDGDTIKVRVKGKIETVRYLLIDTPESKKPDMCIQPYAMAAYLRNDELVKSGILTIELEQENTKDSYGRLLAYVYVDGKSVQETLLKEGFARVGYIMKPPYRYLDLYRDDESLARREKLNIWSRPNFVTKWGFSWCVS
ncbi:Endonuclease YncB, thermonuclease family [Bacillus sp. OV166]|uniref:thermonuclease family protein n=1 Tax=Bacillus sp. OV166 TaxID=1882763 RepID=UPI000A2AD2EE|nr:thermonuclease family protein [Bacillus sp. OV166]SMQ77681.1 Endonuclease YncB, thermonuclease family [Bacillus sp. OV166]